MTQLTPTLYAVEVHNDTIDYSIREGELRFKYIITWITSSIILPKGNWQILGTVTHDAIDFDCGEYAIRSIMKAHGCDLTKKYVIVKLKK